MRKNFFEKGKDTPIERFYGVGEKLFSLDSRGSIRYNSKGYLLFEGHDSNGQFLYYRVSK